MRWILAVGGNSDMDTGFGFEQGSPLITSSAVQAALDGAGAAAALFPATQTTQGRPSDVSTVALGATCSDGSMFNK